MSIAQTGGSTAGRGTPFARYVPDSAEVFVSIRNLAELDSALNRAHAWKLIPLLTGGAASATPARGFSESVRAYVAPNLAEDVEGFLSGEMAVVSSSWEQLGAGLWMIRATEPGAIDRWFPKLMRQTHSTASGSSFLTDTGLSVGWKEPIAILSRRAQDPLTMKALALMEGRQTGSVERDEFYQQLSGHLPGNPLALAYWAPDAASASSGSSHGWSIGANWERAVVGLYEGDGRVELAIRAALQGPRPSGRLSETAIERMLHLPHTTLWSMATTVDFASAIDAATRNPSTSALGRYLNLALSLRGRERPTAKDAIPAFGPHVIAAWDQDLNADGDTPQAALLVECGKNSLAFEETTQLVTNLIQIISTLEPTPANARLTIHRTTRLGAVIGSIPLGPHAQSSQVPFFRLMGQLSPSWAVSEGWLIVTLTREHLERILEAQYDLIPPLGAAPDVHRLGQATSDRTMMSVWQAGLSAEILDRWLEDHEAGKPSLLHSAWWSQPTRVAGAGGQWGIGMRATQEPGVVVVARIQPGSHAEGRLRPDDRIVGIDGQLLSLHAPNSDLRSRLKASGKSEGPTLRLLRDGRAMEIRLPTAQEPPPRASHLAPADLVRELAALAHSLDFASFAALASDERHFSARLTLRFAPIPWPKSTDR